MVAFGDLPGQGGAVRVGVDRDLLGRVDDRGDNGRGSDRAGSHHGAWGYRRTGATTLAWTGPQGRTYTVDHTGTHTDD